MIYKIRYIEYLRFMATLAVILIHVAATLPNNFSISEIGVANYAVMYSCYVIVNWAVPVFLMITGALLLNDYKTLNFEKVKKYLLRMMYVLLIFGIPFAAIEIFMNEGIFSFNIIENAILNTLQGKSWSHIWYIYLLISIYIVAIPIKYGVNKMREKSELDYFIVILCIGNFGVPLLNCLFGLNLETYMQFTHYLTYFILGYRLSTIKKDTIFNINLGNLALCIFLCVTLFKFLISYYWIFTFNEICPYIQDGGKIFTLIQASSLFSFCKIKFNCNKICNGFIINRINKCSFCIYLIHPVFINLFYKMFNFTPLITQVYLGLFIVYFIVFLISWLSSEILTKLPIFNKIL